ncbi:MAG: hypothetical protein RR582_11280, partial [Niameybacter sp.]
DMTTENSKLKVQLDTFMQETEVKTIDLEMANQKLTSEKTNLQLEYNKLSQENKLGQAQTLKNESEWKAAAEVLNNIAINDLKEEKQVVYEELKKSVYPKAGDAFYSEGNSLFKQENYIDAMIQFEKTLLYVPHTKTAANALYNMGQIEEKNNNNNKALQYYTILAKDYEGTSAYYKAKERIKQLTPEES